ncbi:tRNA pseudouridine(55) synthase TruB [Irregularibacter muris]|uniref:tRNA pseudouridine synthase B n=2 Tax=Irregularibacter muris TaxID=1796619 RepID=A0AAE3HEN2_9FIRM|nr:tRNA pseudouridine(55) synthase TruB [Irregularibacter muris]
MDGILNILKPPGMTSHDIINWARRNFKEKKAGHTGTLDPGAAGVLPVYLGKATKVIPYINDEKKTYRAKIVFGATTDTQDSFGQVLSNVTPDFGLSHFKEVLDSFTGEILQKPSIYSAIKVKGKKLYDYARQGKEVDIPVRKIFINEIKILHHNIPQYAFIEVTCSKGTYIRSLCADIGETLGCGAYMGFLLRTASGKFNIFSSHTLEELEESNQKGQLEKMLLPLEFSLDEYQKIHIKNSASNSLKNGNSIYPQGIEEDLSPYKTDQFILAYLNNHLAAIGNIKYEEARNRYYFKPIRVL